MKTCVITPTRNEAKAIGKLVKEIRSYNLDAVVIDDGSIDNTSLIAKDNGAIVLKNEVNLGKGASLKKGFDYAIAQGFDTVITMDGDGQHMASDLPYFIRLAENSDKDIFIGNRMSKTRKMPLTRVLTNKFMSWLISKVAKQDIPDTQCGFRLIRKRVLEKIKLKTCKYETESEILIKAARLGFKIESVPIQSVYANERSQINPFVDTIRFIRLILGEIWITRS